MSISSVYVTADARDDISRDLPFGGGLEAGGPLFGYLDPERERLVIVKVIANEAPPNDARHVFVEVRRWAHLDRPGHRLAGTAHSHEHFRDGLRATPSEADENGWLEMAEQLAEPIAGLIISPRGERYEGGFPVPDWVAPRIDAWVAHPDGRLAAVPLRVEPRWLGNLRAERENAEMVAMLRGDDAA